MSFDKFQLSHFVALAFGALLPLNDVGATTYGDTAYSSMVTPLGCLSQEALSLPLTVGVSSRVYVTARATFLKNDTNSTAATISVALFDSNGATQLASGQIATIGAISLSAFLDANGLLHAGTSNDDPAAPIYVAAPGDYILKMHVQGSGGDCTGVVQFNNVTLTYILLSSAFDRVFANGFQAMLNGNNEARRIS